MQFMFHLTEIHLCTRLCFSGWGVLKKQIKSKELQTYWSSPVTDKTTVEPQRENLYFLMDWLAGGLQDWKIKNHSENNSTSAWAGSKLLSCVDVWHCAGTGKSLLLSYAITPGTRKIGNSNYSSWFFYSSLCLVCVCTCWCAWLKSTSSSPTPCRCTTKRAQVQAVLPQFVDLFCSHFQEIGTQTFKSVAQF